MGNQAARAVFDALFGIGKVTAAAIAQGIQRAITKQATEGFRIGIFMARKILALLMLKKIVMSHEMSPFFPAGNMI